MTQTPGPDDRADQRTADLGFARVDLERAARTGDPEVVYGAGKTPEQVAAILTTLHASHPERAVLATRLSPEAMDAARGAGKRSRQRGSRRLDAHDVALVHG